MKFKIGDKVIVIYEDNISLKKYLYKVGKISLIQENIKYPYKVDFMDTTTWYEEKQLILSNKTTKILFEN